MKHLRERGTDRQTEGQGESEKKKQPNQNATINRIQFVA